MKIFLKILIIALLNYQAFSQIDDILTKLPGIEDYSVKKSVTTGLKDATPVAYWLDDAGTLLKYSSLQDASLITGPGYYRFKIRTFCLHAGTYRPVEGKGCLVAPLKGSRADLIGDIMFRYISYPDIERDKVQVLIWGIESGTKYSELPPEVQAAVLPLLTPQDIALMETDLFEIAADIMPVEIKNILDYYNNLKSKISDVNSTYQDIENLAVLTGIAPENKNDKKIEPGIWSYFGNGRFIRCYPNDYTSADVEIFEPSETEIGRDTYDRITYIDDGLSRIEFIYRDNSENDVTAENQPVNRFQSVLLTDKSSNTAVIIENEGWYIPYQKKISQKSSYKRDNDPSDSEYKNRVKLGKDYLDKIKNSIGKKNFKKLDANEIKMLYDLKQVQLSLDNLSGYYNPAGLENPFYTLSVNALYYKSAILGENFNKGGGNSSLFKNGSMVMVPGNSSTQRTGGSVGNVGGNNNDKKCSYNISLQQLNFNYIPVPGTEITAVLDVSTNGKCKIEGVRFTLFDIGKEKGRCLNDKFPEYFNDEPDFYFDPASNPQFSFSNNGMTAEYPGLMNNVVISCRDYGAYGSLKAEVKIDGKWVTAAASVTKKGYITLPYDNNENNIADVWEKNENVIGYPALWDDDPNPKGQLKNGDGITIYEEYRGFFISDGAGGIEHVRTSPLKKEVFILDDDYLLDFLSWEAASSIKVYLLTEDLVYGDFVKTNDKEYRRVNFNRNYAAGNVFAVKLIKAPGMNDPFNLKNEMSTIGYTSHNIPGTPENTDYIILFPSRIRYMLGELVKNADEELNKNPNADPVLLPSGSYVSRKSLENFRDLPNDFNKFNVLVDFIMSHSAVHEMGHALGLDHHTPDIYSGNSACPMKYLVGGDLVNAYKMLKDICDLISSGDYVIVSYVKWKFCDKPDNCWSKLRLK